MRRRMLYADAIKSLFSLQMFGARPGLETTRRLAALAGSPQERLCFIHVAGTNGKGSTCAMLEAIYRASGLRAGLYTSPHLVSFRERLQVNRQMISETEVARLVDAAQPWLKEFTPENHPTFFELVTVLAAQWFAEQECDVVIWETGLGGRLDATNIVTPLASVITNVQFDHEKWLGETLEAIAGEKAGIIKPGVPVITAATDPALGVIRAAAEKLGAPLRVVTAPLVQGDLSLAGEHQRLNAAMAVQTVETLGAKYPVAPGLIREALACVHWPARFQVLRRGAQTLILDGAHNPDGAATLVRTLREQFPGVAPAFVVGMLDDKNWPAALATFGGYALAARTWPQMVCVPVASPRTALPVSLARVAQEAQPALGVSPAGSLPEAIGLLRDAEVVVVTGSLYLVGEALEWLGQQAALNERALNEWAQKP